jgi:2-polyprenyl-3-methyl-5-hydroxy-6-metoxy-1,4-benzoquinol methylase
MERREHWDHIYSSKTPEQMSWYCPHLNVSLELIANTHVPYSAAIVDIGGGESTLVDDLLAQGYCNLSVLDISQTAIDANMLRLGTLAKKVRWITAEITQTEFQIHEFDLWHDRAVFHFLTAKNDRAEYVRRVTQAVKPGGHVIIGTFGPEGPTRCSGLDVVRYDTESLQSKFGERFRLIASSKHMHNTPFGTLQQFLFCHFRLG